MRPFVVDMFKGLLAFFLLEMGLLVARQLRQVRDVGPFLIGFGLIVPFINAAAALALGAALSLNVGDLTLLATLAASGSYIVVPAVIRYAIPEARPSRYFTLALGITFPVNVIVGIPVYYGNRDDCGDSARFAQQVRDESRHRCHLAGSNTLHRNAVSARLRILSEHAWRRW